MGNYGVVAACHPDQFFALSATASTARFINIGLLSASALLHGSKQRGETIIVSFMLVVLFTNLFDNMTVVTAYPFGAYHHTAAIGPKLWYVPIIVSPIFAVAGYIAWVLAGIFLGHFFPKIAGLPLGDQLSRRVSQPHGICVLTQSAAL
jgi:uncharacterized membrane protein